MNGAGTPYVVDACHGAPLAVILNPHAPCVSNGARLTASPSKPIVQGPAGTCGVVVMAVAVEAVGAEGVTVDPPHAAPSAAIRSTLARPVVLMAHPASPLSICPAPDPPRG